MEIPSIRAWLPQLTDNSDNVDGVNIMFAMPQYDIEGCLKVIENVILNKKKLTQFVAKHQGIYSSKPSTIVKETLGTRINRPNAIKELERPSNFSYYVQNNNYHFVSTTGTIEKELETLETILDYQILPQDIAVVFTKKEELKIMRPESPVVTQPIDNAPEYYRAYKAKLLGGNKISIEFPPLSESKNRVMLYLLDRNIFIQDLDKAIGRQHGIQQPGY